MNDLAAFIAGVICGIAFGVPIWLTTFYLFDEF
jgi:hypothetical protein